MWICVEFWKNDGKNLKKPGITAFLADGKILRNQLLFDVNHGRMKTIKIKQHKQT